MKTHILNYSKTREIYKEYRKSRHKEQFRAAHADAIAKHEAAKAAFDNLGGKQIPKVAELNKEYAALLAEKKACYEEYKAASLFVFLFFCCAFEQRLCQDGTPL